MRRHHRERRLAAQLPPAVGERDVAPPVAHEGMHVGPGRVLHLRTVIADRPSDVETALGSKIYSQTTNAVRAQRLVEALASNAK